MQLKTNQIRKVTIRKDLFDLCVENAKLAEIGGKSQFREEDRDKLLSQDQLVGQLGHLAASLALCGDAKPYIDARRIANLNPYKGDGGADFNNSNFDVKTSKLISGRDPLSYNLLVREHELHDDWVYALALVEEIDEDSHQAEVLLVGWATRSMLPKKPQDDTRFGGNGKRPVYALRASKLKPFPPIQFSDVVGIYQKTPSKALAAISALDDDLFEF